MGIASLSKIKISIPYWLSLLPNSIINSGLPKFWFTSFLVFYYETRSWCGSLIWIRINSNEHISLTTLIVSLSHRSGHLLRKENDPYNEMLSPSKSLISYIYVTYISTKRWLCINFQMEKFHMPCYRLPSDCIDIWRW